MTRRWMPIQRPYHRDAEQRWTVRADCPKKVPFALFDGPRARARCGRNHDQTPERLAERGGLGPAEAVAVLEDLPLREVGRIARKDEGIPRLLAALRGRLVIAETASSTWNYHLRKLAPGEEPKLSGGAPPALCGRALGWDTRMPLDAWGVRDHMPSSWCGACYEKAEELGFEIDKPTPRR